MKRKSCHGVRKKRLVTSVLKLQDVVAVLSALIPGKVVKYLGKLRMHDRVVILYLY
jgi:hypothetical protein